MNAKKHLSVNFWIIAACISTMCVFFTCKGGPGAADSRDAMQCDGKEIKVPEGLEGQALADALLTQWKHDHPDRGWVELEKKSHSIEPGADNSPLLTEGQGDGHTYGKYTEKDILTWARETEKFVVEGSRIFHNAELLGGTVGVSCDMCHPDAANTHPETYPKFQVQLGSTVLLRDMINWCIQNPVRGTTLEADDPRMRALEAYIIAQRRGVKLDYNKH